MYLVFLECRREDEEVVEIACHEVIHVVVEDVVNVVLESTGGGAETKRHDRVFVEAIAGAEGCFPFFAGGHAELMVSVAYVAFREVSGVTGAVEYFVDERQGIAVLDCDLVEASIVDAET